jgi:hypothetical protein
MHNYFVNSASDSSPETSDMSSSPHLRPFENLYLPRRHSGELSPMPQMVFPILQPQNALQLPMEEPELQDDDQPQPMDGVTWNDGSALPSASGTLLLSPGKSSSDCATFQMDFGRLLNGPPNAITASGDIITSVFGDVANGMKLSVDEERFFARHGLYLGISQKGMKTLKRMLSEDDFDLRPAKMSKLEAGGKTEGIRCPSTYCSPTSSQDDSHFVDQPAFWLPYDPKAETAEDRAQEYIDFYRGKSKQDAVTGIKHGIWDAFIPCTPEKESSRAQNPYTERQQYIYTPQDPFKLIAAPASAPASSERQNEAKDTSLEEPPTLSSWVKPSPQAKQHIMEQDPRNLTSPTHPLASQTSSSGVETTADSSAQSGMGRSRRSKTMTNEY